MKTSNPRAARGRERAPRQGRRWGVHGALRRAQADIDLRPELYTHYYREEFPERFRDQIDTRLFGPGERIVFEDYSKDIYDKSRQWIDERGIFEDGIGERSFEQAVIL